MLCFQWKDIEDVSTEPEMKQKRKYLASFIVYDKGKSFCHQC